MVPDTQEKQITNKKFHLEEGYPMIFNMGELKYPIMIMHHVKKKKSQYTTMIFLKPMPGPKEPP
jgi:hypothetical protein